MHAKYTCCRLQFRKMVQKAHSDSFTMLGKLSTMKHVALFFLWTSGNTLAELPLGKPSRMKLHDTFWCKNDTVRLQFVSCNKAVHHADAKIKHKFGFYTTMRVR